MTTEAYGVTCALSGFVIGSGAITYHATGITALVSGVTVVLLALWVRRFVVPR